MRVLVVDDLPANSGPLTKALAGFRCDLIQAYGTEEALRLLATDGVAVAVVSEEATATTGHDLARRARSNAATRNVPIIFIAATADWTALGHYPPGTIDVLPAPVDARLLRNKIQTFLDLAAAQQRLEDQVVAHRRVLAELEAFHHAVAHDLRASLRPLDGLSEALLDDYGDQLDGQEKDYLGRIRIAAGRMERLVDDLGQLARVGHAALHRERVDLSAMVAALVEDIQASEPDRPVEFRGAPDLRPYADGRLLRIAMESLLRSGRTRLPRQIEIGHREGDDRVYYVRDVIPSRGVPQAIIDRVIRRHDGRSWIEAQKDRSATFCFTLPDSRH
jgi:signal transduction histidine kinase